MVGGSWISRSELRTGERRGQEGKATRLGAEKGEESACGKDCENQWRNFSSPGMGSGGVGCWESRDSFFKTRAFFNARRSLMTKKHLPS